MCKHALAEQVTLSHRDDGKRLCVYTDASDSVWSGIVTQVPYEELKNAHEKQRHEPLAFLSGRFNSVQFGWSILEKEAYAILATLDRMYWIAATPDGFDLVTDHNNLIFLFDPLSVMPDMTQTSLRKVLRWAVRLSVYNYTCFHIKGTDNVWADLGDRPTHYPFWKGRLTPEESSGVGMPLRHYGELSKFRNSHLHLRQILNDRRQPTFRTRNLPHSRKCRRIS